MSTYREMNTQMNDVDCLKEALTKVPTRNNKPFVPVHHKEKQSLEGYSGDKRSQKAEIVIPRAQVGGAANDIGFEKQADGNFVAHISDFDRNFYNDKWLAKLKTEYAGLQARKVARTAGATFMGETRKDGKIILRFAKA